MNLFERAIPTVSVVKKSPYKKSLAVKHLESLANIAARKLYPNTPPEYLAPRKFRDDSANSLTKCIIRFLQLKGYQAERINNTGIPKDQRKTFTDVTGRQRTIGDYKWVTGNGTNGTADISAIIKGRSVKIEVKYGADRQSEAQKQYQKTVEMAGGIYIIARTFEGFLNWYISTFGNGKR